MKGSFGRNRNKARGAHLGVHAQSITGDQCQEVENMSEGTKVGPDQLRAFIESM